MTPQWIMHEGTAHLRRAWDGMSAATYCGLALYGVRDRDFREPNASRGESECRACLDRRVEEMKGGAV